jgi:hypothetical protein
MTTIITRHYQYPSGRSRGELRRMVAKVFGHWQGQATSNGTTATLIDTRLSRFADDYFVGAQCWIKWKASSAPGYTAYVTGFVGSTGTLTFAPAMGAATASGDAYELFRYVTKDDIEDALNEVCKGGTAYHQLTPNTDGSLAYTISKIGTLHRPSQVLDVLRYALGDDTQTPQSVRGYRIEDNEGVLTLRLPWALNTSDALWLVYEVGELGMMHDDDMTTLSADVVRARAVCWIIDTLLMDQDEQGMAKFGTLARYWQDKRKDAEQALPRPAVATVMNQWATTPTGDEQPWAALGIISRFAE